MDYFSGWCDNDKRLDGKTMIVTGCNTGIGKEVAMDFYLRGARVIMGCRDLVKAEAAKEDIQKQSLAVEPRSLIGELVVEKLDLAKMSSVRDFVNLVTARNYRIQVLVCNAGVMMCPEGRTDDGFETHIGTNHLGHALLSLLLLPSMIVCAPSRIVFVSSFVHEKHDLDVTDLNFEKSEYKPFEAYCRSKAANILFAKALADKLTLHKIRNVKTYSVHPGVISTEISRHFDETIGYGASWLFNNVLGWFLKSPRCGAQTTIYCAIDDACAEENGLYYSDCMVSTPSAQCRDREQAEKLYDITIKMLSLMKYNPFGPPDYIPKENDA